MTGTSILQKFTQALIAFTLLAAIVAGGQVEQASAAGGTAIRRAEIQVDDEILTVEVVVNARYLRTIRGPIRLVVTLPAGSTGTLRKADRGFNGSGWSVNFRDSRATGVGNVAVTISSHERGVPIELDLSSDSGWAYGVPGTANVTTIVEFYPSTPGLPGPVAVLPRSA